MKTSDLCKWLRNNSSGIYRPARDAADLIEHLTARAEAAEAENSTLRALLPKLGAPCGYCGLTEIAKCVHGFPGCPQADDLLAGEDEAFRETVARMKAAEAGAQRYRWLRDSAEDASHFAPLVFMCDSERELRWGDALTAGRLDAAIDAELAKEPKP